MIKMKLCIHTTGKSSTRLQEFVNKVQIQYIFMSSFIQTT